MKSRHFTYPLLLAGALAFSGCTNVDPHSETARGATVGALLGAAAGAVIGHQSGEAGAGAAIGAVAGGLVGSQVGAERDREYARARHAAQRQRELEAEIAREQAIASGRNVTDREVFEAQERARQAEAELECE
jgi:uncharacterized membrane protein